MTNHDQCLIGLIADKETIDGFRIAGINEVYITDDESNDKSSTNVFVVEKDEKSSVLIEIFKSLLDNKEIAMVFITNDLAVKLSKKIDLDKIINPFITILPENKIGKNN